MAQRMFEQMSGWRLVFIEWVDSYGCSSEWADLSECTPEPMICRSVGWLIHDDSRCKIIVPHLSQPGHPSTEQQGCGDMTIPTSAILKIIDLKVPNLSRNRKRA